MSSGERASRLTGAIFNYGLGSYAPQLVSLVLVPVYSRFIAPAEMGALLKNSIDKWAAVIERAGIEKQ